MLFKFVLCFTLIKLNLSDNQAELNEPEKSSEQINEPSVITTTTSLNQVQSNLRDLIKTTNRIALSTTDQVDKTKSVQIISLYKQPIQYINFTAEYHQQKLSMN